MLRRILLGLIPLVGLWPAAPAFRLPDDVRPERYALDLTLVPGQPSFSGRVQITLTTRQPAAELWLHAKQIRVKSARLNVAGRTVAATASNTGDLLRIEPATPLAAGRARLDIEFEADVQNQVTAGIFQARDLGADYLYSQMEATDARRAFPCFDEPGFKTPWQVTLRVRKEDQAFFNTPVLSEQQGSDGFKTIRFAETQPLPTYLIAVAVGPFEVVEAGRAGQRRTPVRIIVPKGRSAQARYAAQITPRILTELEGFLGLPYPFEKLDSLAIPLTAGFSAMETPGLTTYASRVILHANPDSDPSWQRAYANTASHEIGHHWFGDSVTPGWWDDIWLNESFATWISGQILARIRPDWDAAAPAARAANGVMGSDTVLAARPVHVPVNAAEDMGGIFNGISYQKGAAVIRMVEHWMGETAFRNTIRGYLRRHAGRNATTGDFLDAFGAVKSLNVARVFRAYLDQPGVPAVRLRLLCDRTPRLALTQQRIVPMGVTAPPGQMWRIPICVRYPGSDGKPRRACFEMERAEQEFALAGAASCPEWVQANESAKGYYRVIYDGQLLSRLLSAKDAALTVAERINLLGDAGALGDAGLLPPTDALKLAASFAGDADTQIANAAAGVAGGYAALIPESLRPAYAAFLRTAFGPIARRLGWTPKEGEPIDDAGLRNVVLDLVAVLGQDAGLRSEAGALALEWAAGRKQLPDLLARTVIRAAGATDAPAIHEALSRAVRAEANPATKLRMFEGLASFRDPLLLGRSFQLMLDPELDARVAMPAILNGAAREPSAGMLPFEFVRDNWAAMRRRSPDTLGGSLLLAPLRALCSEDGASTAAEFYSSRLAEAGYSPRALAESLQRVRACAATRTAQQASLAEFLNSYRR